MTHNFLTESARVFEETATLGSFERGTRANDFDTTFQEARDMMLNKSVDIMRGVNPMLLNHDSSLMKTYKESMLEPLKNDCEEIEIVESSDEYTFTHGMSSLYDMTSQLWDNCVEDHITESTNVGNLLPIKSIDYPFLYRANVATCSNMIMQTESTPTPIIRKRFEQEYIYDPKDGTRWKYPQCVYDTDEFSKIINAAKGIPIKSDKVPLPLFQYKIIEELTDATVPDREEFTYDLRIVKVFVGDTEIVLPRGGIYVSMEDKQFRGGRIDVVLPDGTKVSDEIQGSVDWINKTINLNNINPNSGITAVQFEGKLSNIKNERTVRFDRDREEIEFKIDDGAKIDMPLFLEDIEDHKALLNIDLYQWAYGRFSDTLNDFEDNDTLSFLDEMYHRYKGIQIDPAHVLDLDYSFVSEMVFDCDGSTSTIALQSDYIENMLKWHIDRYLINICDTVKLDNLTFVMYGNPRYISLLGSSIKWVKKNGGQLGGVKLDWSYGLYTTGDVSVQVVSNKKISHKKYPGIRIVAYPTDKNTYTFRRYKYSYHILKGEQTGYRAADLPGGSKTYILGTNRYVNTMIQGIQGHVTFDNSEFIQLHS